MIDQFAVDIEPFYCFVWVNKKTFELVVCTHKEAGVVNIYNGNTRFRMHSLDFREDYEYVGNIYSETEEMYLYLKIEKAIQSAKIEKRNAYIRMLERNKVPFNTEFTWKEF